MEKRLKNICATVLHMYARMKQKKKWKKSERMKERRRRSSENANWPKAMQIKPTLFIRFLFWALFFVRFLWGGSFHTIRVSLSHLTVFLRYFYCMWCGKVVAFLAYKFKLYAHSIHTHLNTKEDAQKKRDTKKKKKKEEICLQSEREK